MKLSHNFPALEVGFAVQWADALLAELEKQEATSEVEGQS
jgi:hypothetical protein